MKHTLIILCIILTIPISAADQAQNLHRYIWANFNHAQGNFDVAQKWYDEIFSNKNTTLDMYKGYIALLRDQGKFHQIVALIPKLELNTSFSEDPVIQLILIQALEKADQRDKAVERLIKANNVHKENQEIAFFAANMYMQRKEPKNALIVIENFLENTPNKPNNFIFHFLKAQILVHLNQKDQALEQIKQCIQMHPSFEKGWLLYSMLHEEKNNFKEAIKGYTTYLDISGGNKEVEKHLLSLVLKQKMLSEKTKSVKVNEQALKQVLSLFEQKRFQDALEYLDKHINNKHNPDKPERNIKLENCDDKTHFKCAYNAIITPVFISEKDVVTELLARREMSSL